MEITLKDLVGAHELSGLDDGKTSVKDAFGEDDTANCVRFILDGQTYEAIEDPADGWRSYCDGIKLSSEKVENRFPPQKVLVSIDESEKEILEFRDMTTAEIVLRIGTDYSMDYYPCCILDWRPQNLAINQKAN